MRKIILLLLLCLGSCYAKAQNEAYKQYINTYKGMAIEQMRRYGIPASITLAQGLLESGAGTSFLAITANNHFGIKTGGTWDGAFVFKDDDKRGERFRKYENPQQSYEDHSLFLTTRSRYASLFQLDKLDYQGWARGLKAAGYATNPKYADKLISLIDLYDLTQYDRISFSKPLVVVANEFPRMSQTAVSVNSIQRAIRQCNGLRYVVANADDKLEIISRQTGVSEHRLKKFNELPEHYVLKAGDIIFLDKKGKRAASVYKDRQHKVQVGESLYSIAQRYGIQLKYLYKMNNFPYSYQARVGDEIRVY